MIVKATSFTNTRLFMVILVVCVVVLFGIAGTVDHAAEEIEHKEYCKSIDIWGRTDGNFGHPDYKGIEQTCEEGGDDD